MAGSVLIYLALATILGTILSYYYAYKGDRSFIPWGRRGYFATSILLIAASVLLLTYILTHRFEFAYVFSYSSTDLPLPLLISTFFAGQEGSFLLWGLFSMVVGIYVMKHSRKEKFEADAMMLYSLVLLFFIVMLIVKSPFMYLWDKPGDFQARMDVIPPDVTSYVNLGGGLWAPVPEEGYGLNPLLQNYWMVLHPPVLFVGFAALAVPFVYALVGLLRRDWNGWIAASLPWLAFGGLVLGAGIMMGGYWAYETLGWGGYWAWDPVENSSLVPWMLCVALIHTAVVQRKNETYIRTNLLLAILMFVSVIYSTFLTRSGVLSETSVHSFGDPGTLVYSLLVAFNLGFLILGIVLLAKRWKEIPVKLASKEILSRDFVLFLGTFALVLSAFMIIVGTSAPLITKIFQGKASAVEIDYYVRSNLPIAIVMTLLAGLSQLLSWQTTSLKEIRKLLTAILLIGVAVTAIFLTLYGYASIAITLFVFGSAIALVANLRTAYRMFNETPLHIGGSMSHLGFAIMCIGFVTTSVHDSTQIVTLREGKPERVLGYAITYTEGEEITPQRLHAHVEVGNGARKEKATMIMYINPQNGEIVRKPDILNLVSQDIYLEPLQLIAPSLDSVSMAVLPEGVVVQASLKPGINFVWVGTLMVLLGFALATYRRYKERRLIL